MKRTYLVLAVIALLIVGLSLSACTSRKMMPNDQPMKRSSY